MPPDWRRVLSGLNLSHRVSATTPTPTHGHPRPSEPPCPLPGVACPPPAPPHLPPEITDLQPPGRRELGIELPTPSHWPLMTTLEISPTIEASPSAFPGSMNARVLSALRPQRTCPPTFPRTQCRLPQGSDHTFILLSELMEAQPAAHGGRRGEARPGHRQTGGGPIWI